MDRLFTPWRYAYISKGEEGGGCVFCEKPQLGDREALIVLRGEHNYVILNLYPYTSGHAMVVPYAHISELHQLPAPAAQEMMQLTQRLEGALRRVYRPDGVNVGMNIGKAAGAGVAGHIHMHLLPRWVADSNFVSVIGETRILPEELGETWRRLREAMQ